MKSKIEIKKLSKIEINKMPLIEYSGEIQLCDNIKDAEKFAKELLIEEVLGFDTETKPTFNKGEYNLPSLIQLASSKKVYLFHIRNSVIPPTLLKVFNEKSIIKTGVAIKRDIDDLKKINNFKENGFIELTKIAKNLGVENLGLRSLVALFLKHKISKKEQVSNWARKKLTNSQKKYAATDAWISRKLYIFLKEENLLSR